MSIYDVILLVTPQKYIHKHNAVIIGDVCDLEGEIAHFFSFGVHFGSHFEIGKISFQQDISTNAFLNPSNNWY